MKRFNILMFNEILEMYEQDLRAELITGKKIELSNGICLISEQEIRKCKRRVMQKQIEYLARFDAIYSGNKDVAALALKEAKSACSRKGGLAVQQKHGNNIRNNLNTGVPWNKGVKTGNEPWNKGLSKHNNETIRIRFSEDRIGEKNPMWGKTHTPEYKLKQSERVKDSILKGEFTPNSNNRNTHWDAQYNNKQYRSSWEALYHSLNPCAEYEELRVGYTWKGKTHVYILDFIDHRNKIVTEVKPRELCSDPRTVVKFNAAKEWCNNNNYEFLIADLDYFHSREKLWSQDGFDAKTLTKIQALYEVDKKNRN